MKRGCNLTKMMHFNSNSWKDSMVGERKTTQRHGILGTVALHPTALNNAVSVQSTYFIPPYFSTFPFALSSFLSFPCVLCFLMLLSCLIPFLFLYTEECGRLTEREIYTKREVPAQGCSPITTVVAHVCGGSCRYLRPFIQSSFPSPI